ncbi:hypothetical protein MPH_04333 [Macrophomina phaseolina MS6]|uniref:Uncharacterized protein n=1 Tax=Macrophomina phaseolina (strain MS6) TaxID=1126212 RepID=K2R818_MACPH|nr:hypothetical protein MPH_04333 [Macrophomina phaseolina MS6]
MIVTSRTEAAMTRPRVTRAATAKVAADRIKADRTTTVRKTTNRVTEDGKAGYIVVDGSLRDELQHRCITYSVTVAKTTTLTYLCPTTMIFPPIRVQKITPMPHQQSQSSRSSPGRKVQDDKSELPSTPQPGKHKEKPDQYQPSRHEGKEALMGRQHPLNSSKRHQTMAPHHLIHLRSRSRQGTRKPWQFLK